MNNLSCNRMSTRGNRSPAPVMMLAIQVNLGPVLTHWCGTDPTVRELRGTMPAIGPVHLLVLCKRRDLSVCSDITIRPIVINPGGPKNVCPVRPATMLAADAERRGERERTRPIHRTSACRHDVDPDVRLTVPSAEPGTRRGLSADTDCSEQHDEQGDAPRGLDDLQYFFLHFIETAARPTNRSTTSTPPWSIDHGITSPTL